MTTEEKAKAYDEALEKARATYDKEPTDGYVGYANQILKELFPTLAESEDERIRQKLMWLLQQDICPFPEEEVTQMLNYLEKQKEPEEELVYRLNGLMQEYINEGADEDEKEHRLKCYQLFWDALEDTSYFEQKEPKPISSYDIVPYIDDKIASLQDMWREEKVAFDWDDMKDMIEDVARHFYQKEQKPASTEDMPYITDERFYEREPADSFKYKLAEYMTRCCTKKEGPYGYEYGISAESILKMAEEELLKRGVVQKPAWKPSEEQMEALAYASQVLGSDLSPRAAKASEELEGIREHFKKL